MSHKSREQQYYIRKDIGKKGTIGYVYVRKHPSYDDFDACKLGSTKNINARDRQYVTGEVTRGHFALVLEVPLNLMKYVDRRLKEYFKEYSVTIDGGVEFYSKSIIPLIKSCLKDCGIKFKKIHKKDIDALVVTPMPKRRVYSLRTKARNNIVPLRDKALKKRTELEAKRKKKIGDLTVELVFMDFIRYWFFYRVFLLTLLIEFRGEY